LKFSNCPFHPRLLCDDTTDLEKNSKRVRAEIAALVGIGAEGRLGLGRWVIVLIPADAYTRFRETRQELFQDFFQKEVAQKVTKTTKAGFQGSEIISKARRNRRIAIKECRMSKGRAAEPSTAYAAFTDWKSV
jgi:hypothetical protein